MATLKVLVNATTLVVGGGVQVGISFVESALSIKRDVEFSFLLSKEIYYSLIEKGVSSPNFTLVDRSPAHPIKGIKSRQLIKSEEVRFSPDIVYSIGFPSYIKFKSIEVGRYTNPWEINSEPLPWELFTTRISKVVTKLGIFYRQFWAKRSDYLETQTEMAKLGISSRLSFDKNKIFVLPNSVNKIFMQDDLVVCPREGGGQYTIFSLAAGYPHKNLEIIPKVIDYLVNNCSMNVKFIVTLDSDSDIWKSIKHEALYLNVFDHIENIGRISLEDCLEIYKRSHLVFLPTLLEVFSATYLEAMFVGVPIVTSDRDFARGTCCDAASYIDPYSPKEAGKAISYLLLNPLARETLIMQGKKLANSLPRADEKMSNLLEFTRIF